MERLRQRDIQDKVEHRPLTDEQKAAIAEVRSYYGAQLAQEDVMHASALAGIREPDARAAFQQEYRRTCERLNSARDAKIERIRSGNAEG